ncbi:MAG: type II secretion system ATPase GspE [Myxococcales bacterium]|nr:type II secretion system ATPase GspE [Myxococcales bacterium]MCB9669497.1 type II secretion system ATPase GspE [Alphaproteobacteria bacterium]MCB9692120.1 type II secretion system ATPase GspE [Alphaproteobacteria bacterium]
MAVRRGGLDELLKEAGVADAAIQAVHSMAEKQSIPLQKAATRVADAPAAAVARALSRLSGLPVLETVDVEVIDVDMIRRLPLSIARENGILPLYLAGDELVVGIAELSAFSTLDDLRVLYGRPVRPVLVPTDVLEKATNDAYDKAATSADAIIADAGDKGDDDGDFNLEDAELLDDPNQAPIIRFVNAVISEAIKEKVSDIHIEPYEKEMVVRYRLDGVLKETIKPPVKFKNPIVARIKIMAGLNIAEKRLPQDGRIRRKMGGREIDMRVSTVPVRHGERVVMRILEKGTVFSLDAIGMPKHVLHKWRGLITRPHGILLVSGPTGSGKSTSLYSSITEINTPDKNILTIEDPVEYEVKGIGQVQVNHKIELTFASALRAFLRQDPDVILVGEIRDRETAGRAIEASLTGHLVFSTIHTNDAAGAFVRLVEMGIEPYQVTSSLLGVLAQRLVRRLCNTCKEAYTPTDLELVDLGLTREQVPGMVYRPVGCEECKERGYKGRIGIYEFLESNDQIGALILANADSGSVKKRAVELGMSTLRDDGIQKVLNGMTSFEELIRVTSEDSE